MEFAYFFLYPRSCLAQILRLGANCAHWRCFQGWCQGLGEPLHPHLSPLLLIAWPAPALHLPAQPQTGHPVLMALVRETFTRCLPPACWNPLSAVGFPMGLVPPHLLLLPAQQRSLPALRWVHGPAVTQDGAGWSQGHVHGLCRSPRGPRETPARLAGAPGSGCLCWQGCRERAGRGAHAGDGRAVMGSGGIRAD